MKCWLLCIPPALPIRNQLTKRKLKDLLYILPSFNGKGTDMYSWICAAQHDINDINVNAILKQYARLLKKIGKNTMSYTILDKLYEGHESYKGLDEEAYRSFLSVRDMVNNFPSYLARRLKDCWEGAQTKVSFKVWIYRGITCVLDFNFEGEEHTIETVAYSEGRCSAVIWRRDHKKISKKILEVLEKTEEETWNYDESDLRARMSFPFDTPQECIKQAKECLENFF